MIQHQLTSQFSQRLEGLLHPREANFSELATAVRALSDFYVNNPGAATPWQNAGTVPAYLSYFLPLNFVRLRAVFAEVRRFLPPESIAEVWDFGSGLGTTHWVLEDEPELPPRPFFALERSMQAIDLHRKLEEQQPTHWTVKHVDASAPGPQALGVFSYSFLEMQRRPPPLKDFAHLLIVEPSMRECSRELMSWRDRLMQQGFQPLAPCTHSQGCPLLLQSNKDWCHQRIHFSGPAWWENLENLLPMKNRTLTYSYLLLSQNVQDSSWRGTARAIGDTLEENGKTRQMICRGPQREFLSWLHKRGPAPHIPHGALIRGVDTASVHGGGELRPAPDALTWEE